jgi:DNA invertase Pin-like site-specific DNA recombinase
MNAIDKIRLIVDWLNAQSEYFNEQFTNIRQLEKIYDFAKEKGYEFLDDDYIFSELTEEERIEVYKFIDKVKKLKP